VLDVLADLPDVIEVLCTSTSNPLLAAPCWLRLTVDPSLGIIHLLRRLLLLHDR
jgi:hypothetical protein